MTLSEYQSVDQLYASETTLIFRGIRLADNRSVIIKILDKIVSKFEEIAHFNHEYQILLDLKGLKYFPTVLDYFEEENNLVMVLDDIQGETLQYHIHNKPLSVTEFLPIAILIISALNELHIKGIIHKDINPTNLIWNRKTNCLNIIDFNIATKLLHEKPEISNLNLLQGTIAYISPEQTGRMNRNIDQRSDYYALGVSFYEMLTGRLPFMSNDPLEVIHMHIAKYATPVHEINNQIPVVISEIIAKLMSKNAEERYQTEHGIIEDLTQCLQQLQKNNYIQSFPIGTKDLIDRFEIPQQLYGRENDIKMLLDLFKNVCLGDREIAFVSGYAGIGKSSIIHEMNKPIIANRGYFLQGRFDQIQRNIPVLALRKMLQDFANQILTESEEQISEWRKSILNAVGENGIILIDLAPEMELILGKQLELVAVDYNAADARFFYVLKRFIQLLANKDHPIAIFWDDLQWADSISLRLLEDWLMDSSLSYIFIIVAYRENEVFETHPLQLFINKIKDTINYHSVILQPLDLNSVTDFISNTVHTSKEQVRELATTIHHKTGGNPFFITYFLRGLYNKKLLYFDYDRECWQWNLSTIIQQSITDNVLDLMISHISILDPQTAYALSLSACIGNIFDLKSLAYLLNKPQIEAAKILEIALQENYLIPLNENYLYATEMGNINVIYKFAHDKIQEATYSLLSKQQQSQTKILIGRFLLKTLSKQEIENNVLTIASYFSSGIDLITVEERHLVIELNLQAGLKAKASQAYEQALFYLQIGINLLNEIDWQDKYQLALSLYNETADACSFLGKYKGVKLCAAKINKHARTIQDTLEINRVKLFYAIAKGKPYIAVGIGLEFLSKFDIKLSIKPSKWQLFLALIKAKIVSKGIKPKDIYDLPISKNEKVKAIMQIITDMSTPAYEVSPELTIIMMCISFTMTINNGISEYSPVTIGAYGMIEAGIFKNYDLGYEYGKVALALIDKVPKWYYAKAICIFVYFLNHIKQSSKENLELLTKAYHEALDVGNFEAAVMALNFESVLETNAGYPLDEILVNIHNRVAFFKKSHHLFEDRYRIINEQTILNYLDLHKKSQIHIFEGPIYDEKNVIPSKLYKNDVFGIAYLYIQKLQLAYIFEDYDAAFSYANIIRPHINNLLSSQFYPLFIFYDSLTLIAVYFKMSWYKKIFIRLRLQKDLRQLRRLADAGPQNFKHKYYLVKAELARLDNNFVEAYALYDAAIKLASDHMHIIDKALSKELAGKFFFENDKEKVAKLYLLESYYDYSTWGSKAKLSYLNNKYSWLKKIDLQHQSLGRVLSIFESNTLGIRQDVLDYTSILKTSIAVSTEIVLPKLISRMLDILTQNVAAERCILLLQSNGKLYIEGEYVLQNGIVSLMQSIPLVIEKTLLPLTIIQYVNSTHNSIVLDDASTSKQFMRDFYITQYAPKSVLCSAILYQGEVLGLLYFENNLITGCFTPQRLELLNVLSSQLAASLQNARLYSSFERFVPKQLLELFGKKQIIDVRLGDSIQINITAMFTDIRDFTTITEKQNVAYVFKLLNDYLGTIEPLIIKHNGFIDKYIGDAILALFPESVDSAILAGIELLNAIETFNHEHIEQYQTGIGISSGLSMVGTLGSTHRMDSTVISNSVNTASRLEGLNKIYGTKLLIDDKTRRMLHKQENFTLRCIDKVRLKGKHEIDVIWEVLDYLPEEIKMKRIANISYVEQAMVAYQTGDFMLAKSLFLECSKRDSGDTLLCVFLQRCDHYLRKGAPGNWDGSTQY